MKVALISSADKIGGAAIACWRLGDALSRIQIDARLVVQKQTEPHPMVIHSNPGLKKLAAWYNEYSERLTFIPKAVNKDVRFYFSLGTIGQDLSTIPFIKEADVIHLHWINKGFLSFGFIEKLIQLGKPIVWTMHDMWPFTGGCHYSGSCTHFKNSCGDCWYLKNGNSKDLSTELFSIKKAFYDQNPNIIFTCPSQWLLNLGKQSTLLKNQQICHIPNTINLQEYKPLNQEVCRKKLKLPIHKKLIFFIAMNIRDKRKGMEEFRYSIDLYLKNHPKIAADTELVIMGKNKGNSNIDFPLKTYYLSQTTNPELIKEAYNACDLVAVPSLQDNFPNTVLEAMACGIPVIAFQTGGIPEMIKHKQTGYIAKKANCEDFAKGIDWILKDNEKHDYLKKASRKRAHRLFDYRVICRQFYQLYKEVIDAKKSSNLLISKK